MLSVLVMAGTLLVLQSLNAATQRADRHRVTQDALIKAKEALIARAATDANRPGSLPCPDANDDGVADLFAGNDCPAYIGRLPWKTLDVPDLRDASGERLWYALSNTYRDHSSAEPINSNTAGALSVAGTQTASNLVAIVFSPGAVLKRAGALALQNRTCTVGVDCDASRTCTTSPAANTPKCNPVNYLDATGGIDNADGNSSFVAAVESESFNDRLIEISSDEIMSLVERRAGRELAGYLRAHYDAWQSTANVVGTKGFYPWAANFVDPSNPQPGVNANSGGLLPLGSASAVWTSAVFPLGLCVGVGTSQIQCTGVVFCFIACPLSLSARIGGIATAFVEPPNGTEVTTAGLVIGGATSTWTLNPAAQALDFSYTGSVVGFGLVFVTVNIPPISTWTTTSWLAMNAWNQVSYYAISAGYGINGTDSCGGAAPPCLSVSNTSAPINDKQALVVTSGRTLLGQSTRPVAPPASVTDYLEAGNQDPTDLAFERNLRNASFNDQPAIVRP